MKILTELFGGVLGMTWMLAGPITYIVCVVDTWSGHASVIVKILISLTLDALLAAIWPITWAIWLVQYFIGSDSPMTRVLGF